MAKFNEDGNLLGRISALALLGVAGFLLGKLCCMQNSLCPLPKATRACSISGTIRK